jgi:hypothetical protein
MPSAQTSEVGGFEHKLNMQFTSEADRTARYPAPIAENDLSSLAAEDRVEIWNTASWISLYPRSLFHVVRRTTDAANINNSTALVSDPTLVTTLPAVTGVFYWEDTIFYSSSAAGRYKVAYTWPGGGSVGFWAGLGLAIGSTTTTGDVQAAETISSGTSAPYGGAGVGTRVVVKIWGELSLAGTGGTLQLQYAQNTADATNTVPAYTGSHRRVWRVS